MNLEGILDIVGRSNTGRVRTHNEDYIDDDAKIGLVVLADGMGGYQGGEVASTIAVTTIMDDLRKTIPKLSAREIDENTGYSRVSIVARQSILKANESIYNTSQSQPHYQSMGTTLVLGVFYDNQLTVAHVGDSRMYRFRNNKLQQITVDHTLLQELVDRGYYTSEEAQKSLNKNLVTRALGIEFSVAVDIHEETVHPDDIYLLCSDGLYDMVDDNEIYMSIMRYQDDLEQLADQLIALANTKGGRDNISVLLARPNKTFSNKKHWYKRVVDWFV